MTGLGLAGVVGQKPGTVEAFARYSKARPLAAFAGNAICSADIAERKLGAIVQSAQRFHHSWDFGPRGCA